MSYIKEQNKLLETLLKIKKFKNLVITGLNQDHKCANCHMSTMCYEYDTDKIHNNLNSFLNFFINNNIQANNLVIENNEFLSNEISLNLFFDLINSNLFPKITIKTDLNLINPDIIKILLEQDFGIDLEFHFYNNGLLDLNNPANALLLKNKYIIKFFGLVTPDNCTDWIANYLWWQETLKDQLDDILKINIDKNAIWDNKAKSNLYKLMQIYFQNSFTTDEEFAEKVFNNKLSFIDFSKQSTGCDVYNDLVIDITTLNIIPCGGFKDNKYNYGSLIEDKIVENNVGIATRLLYADQTIGAFGCDICPFAMYCERGCYKHQFDTTTDPLINDDNTCDIEKFKIISIIKMFKELQFLNYLANQKNYKYEEQKNKFLNFVQGV